MLAMKMVCELLEYEMSVHGSAVPGGFSFEYEVFLKGFQKFGAEVKDEVGDT